MKLFVTITAVCVFLNGAISSSTSADTAIEENPAASLGKFRQYSGTWETSASFNEQLGVTKDYRENFPVEAEIPVSLELAIATELTREHISNIRDFKSAILKDSKHRVVAIGDCTLKFQSGEHDGDCYITCDGTHKFMWVSMPFWPYCGKIQLVSGVDRSHDFLHIDFNLDPKHLNGEAHDPAVVGFVRVIRDRASGLAQ